LFKVDTSGTETVLYRFNGPPDGAGPLGALLLDTAGNLYGTTTWGGTGTALSVVAPFLNLMARVP
jgi:hypothetical protein